MNKTRARAAMIAATMSASPLEPDGLNKALANFKWPGGASANPKRDKNLPIYKATFARYVDNADKHSESIPAKNKKEARKIAKRIAKQKLHKGAAYKVLGVM